MEKCTRWTPRKFNTSKEQYADVLYHMHILYEWRYIPESRVPLPSNQTSRDALNCNCGIVRDYNCTRFDHWV